MGMFDTIHVDPRVVEAWDMRNPKTGELAFSLTYQTKDLENVMGTYYLGLDDKGVIRLYSVDEPDKKYWREYTDKEIDEYNKQYENTQWRNIFTRQKGDGEFSSEGWDVKNRYKRSMGEHPHQYLRMYELVGDVNKSYHWIEYKIKFTDGIAESFTVEIEKKGNE